MIPRRLAALALLGAAPAWGQMLGTTAVRDVRPVVSAGMFLDTFDFLDVAGASVRGEMPLTRRVTPFVELGAVRYETSVRGNLPGQAEASWLFATGAKVHAWGEPLFGRPVTVSGYGRLSFGHLKNIDLFSGQALVLGTYDLSDHLPLALSLGAGISYRRTDADVAAAARATTNQSRPRFVFAGEWGFGQRLALEAELAYEEQASGGLGLKYRR